MKHLLADALHLFVIFMMVVFVLGGILAAGGAFDHWTERYNLKRRRRHLLKGRSILKGDVPYYAAKPNKETISYNANI